jgi:hypothetical protein
VKQESLRGGEDLLETAPNGIAPSSLRDYELPNSKILQSFYGEQALNSMSGISKYCQ